MDMERANKKINDVINEYVNNPTEKNFNDFFYEVKQFFYKYSYKYWSDMCKEDREDLILTTIEKYFEPKWIEFLRDKLHSAKYTTWLICDFKQRKMTMDVINKRHRKKYLSLEEQNRYYLNWCCYISNSIENSIKPLGIEYEVLDKQNELLNSIKEYLNEKYDDTRKDKYKHYIDYFFDGFSMEDLVKKTGLSYQMLQVRICRVGKEVRNFFDNYYKQIKEIKEFNY